MVCRFMELRKTPAYKKAMEKFTDGEVNSEDVEALHGLIKELKKQGQSLLDKFENLKDLLPEE